MTEEEILDLIQNQRSALSAKTNGYLNNYSIIMDDNTYCRLRSYKNMFSSGFSSVDHLGRMQILGMKVAFIDNSHELDFILEVVGS